MLHKSFDASMTLHSNACCSQPRLLWSCVTFARAEPCLMVACMPPSAAWRQQQLPLPGLPTMLASIQHSMLTESVVAVLSCSILPPALKACSAVHVSRLCAQESDAGRAEYVLKAQAHLSQVPRKRWGPGHWSGPSGSPRHAAAPALGCILALSGTLQSDGMGGLRQKPQIHDKQACAYTSIATCMLSWQLGAHGIQHGCSC